MEMEVVVNKTAYTRRLGERGFSLVEIMVAVMILGIGLVMAASAFPVGLRYSEESEDRTIAAMLAHSAVSAVKTQRTIDAWEDSLRECWACNKGHVSIVECFSGSAGVKCLFEYCQTNAGGHTTYYWPGDEDGDGYLADMLDGGATTNDWLPTSERVYGPDPRYGYQVFYQRMADPDSTSAPDSSARTFQLLVLVQKSPCGNVGSFSDKFPPPEKVAATSVWGVSPAKNTFKISGYIAIYEGARVINIANGNVYRVVDVDLVAGEKEVTISRTPSVSLGQDGLWVVNHVVGTFASLASKTLP